MSAPRPNVYSVPTEQTSPRFCGAFAAGARGTVIEDGVLRPGPVALWGSPALWDLLLAARAAGRTWYYGDKGYFGRGTYYRVTRDDFQTPRMPPMAGAQRARAERVLTALGVVARPWQRDGRHVLVCPPSPEFVDRMRRAGVSVPAAEEWGDWGGWAVRELARHTDRPVRVRTKADFRAGKPLSRDLRDCWALVTFMSNTAVEAAMAGVPVFVLGPAAGAAFGLQDLARIERPEYPDYRQEVALSLAARQWTLHEIAAGVAWEALN